MRAASYTNDLGQGGAGEQFVKGGGEMELCVLGRFRIFACVDAGGDFVEIFELRGTPESPDTSNVGVTLFEEIWSLEVLQHVDAILGGR